MRRIIWNEIEREPDEHFEGAYEDYVEEMETKVMRGLMADSFCAEPLDDHVARLCLELELPPEAAETWRDLPDPPDDPDPDDPDDDTS